jgi:hypothetical protein
MRAQIRAALSVTPLLVAALVLATAAAVTVLLAGEPARQPALRGPAVGAGTPAGELLAFWRAMTDDRRAAYGALDPALRRRLSYAGFVRAARGSDGAFERSPRIVRTATIGAAVRIYVRPVRSAVARTDSALVVFTMRRERGVWHVAGRGF